MNLWKAIDPSTSWVQNEQDGQIPEPRVVDNGKLVEASGDEKF